VAGSADDPGSERLGLQLVVVINPGQSRGFVEWLVGELMKW
jgi:hypothetical protein